jgi:hypothetical protein
MDTHDQVPSWVEAPEGRFEAPRQKNGRRLRPARFLALLATAVVSFSAKSSLIPRQARLNPLPPGEVERVLEAAAQDILRKARSARLEHKVQLAQRNLQPCKYGCIDNN